MGGIHPLFDLQFIPFLGSREGESPYRIALIKKFTARNTMLKEMQMLIKKEKIRE
jgi:hypothetical protein